MKIFLDTAYVDQIRRAADANLIDGITTNPSLLMQAAGQRDPSEIFLEICETVDGPVSAEVVAIEKDKMLAEGRRLAKIHDNIVVKVPLTEDGLWACRGPPLRGHPGERYAVLLCDPGAPSREGRRELRLPIRGSRGRRLWRWHGSDRADQTGV